MKPPSRTPEGYPNRCPVCRKDVCIDPSIPPGDAPCPHCGQLLWFDSSVPKGTEGSRGKRSRLFQHATKQASQENYKYAVGLLAQCVNSNPSNLLYVRYFIDALQKLYGNNRKGSPLANFKELSARSALKKALSENQWHEVLKHGFKILAVNPWETPVLRAMATASSRMGGGDCELYYLHCALQADSTDPETNKQCGQALAERRQFDQAIACWRRVEQARPGNEEAKRAIADLESKRKSEGHS